MTNNNTEDSVRCERGHYYNPQEHQFCPYCHGKEANKNVGVTRPAEDLFDTMAGEDLEKTVSARGMEAEAGRSSYESYGGMDIDDDERTVSAYMKARGLDPVVGWLVTVSGPLKGKDYRIHADNNFIGRSKTMSICIQGDDTISKENHAKITYDSRAKIFYFTALTGKNIVRVNDKAVFTTTELAPYDIIEIGVTKFVFISFCGEKFDWDKVLAQETAGGE